MAAYSLFWVQPIMADQFDDQIAALNAQIASQKQQMNQLATQADSLSTKVDSLNVQITEVNNRLALARTELAQLNANLAATKAKLAEEKKTLGEDLRTMYLDGQTSPIEVLASSGSFGEYLDQQQYLQSLRDHVQASVDEVTATQASLEKQQQDQQQLIAEQSIIQSNLNQQEQQLADLLASTQGQESAYQAQTQQEQQKIAQLRAQQAAAIAAASRHVQYHGGGGAGGACDIGQGNGGYPSIWCNAGQDTRIDDWGMYNRECVSYAAWATEARGHSMPYWGGRGNANQWPGNARASGIPVDNSPSVGAVGIWMGGPYGHAMIVEQVKSTSVIVSSMNADNNGHFQYDEWPISSLVFIHFR